MIRTATSRTVSPLVMGCALLLAACGGSSPSTPGTSTGATGTTSQACIDNGWTNLTYSSFGQPFFAKYCTSCHSTGSANRHGAPADVNFDNVTGISDHAARIDALAGMNIAGTVKNTAMPLPGAATAFPTDTERQQLACWIAAGLP